MQDTRGLCHRTLETREAGVGRPLAGLEWRHAFLQADRVAAYRPSCRWSRCRDCCGTLRVQVFPLEATQAVCRQGHLPYSSRAVLNGMRMVGFRRSVTQLRQCSRCVCGQVCFQGHTGPSSRCVANVVPKRSVAGRLSCGVKRGRCVPVHCPHRRAAVTCARQRKQSSEPLYRGSLACRAACCDPRCVRDWGGCGRVGTREHCARGQAALET